MNKLDELYSFVASDYYATGEGVTKCLLITRAYPRDEDYEVKPETVYIDGKYHFNPGVVKFGPGFRAIREFNELFGGFYGRGAQLYAYEEFMKKFEAYIPKVVVNLLSDPSQPGNFHWHTEVHMNFS